MRNLRDSFNHTLEPEALMNAVKEGNRHGVENLLQLGMDVDAKDKHGYTALMWAAYKGDVEIVKLLIEHDADLNLKSLHGSTPLIFAVKSRGGHEEIVRLLIDKGALLDEKDDYGRTAFDWAKIDGHEEIQGLIQTALKVQEVAESVKKMRACHTIAARNQRRLNKRVRQKRVKLRKHGI